MVHFPLKYKPLPSAFVATPQELARMIAERILFASDKSSFVVSDTQPTSNVGPWFKNGKQLWVWDSGSSTYVPLAVNNTLTPQVAIQATTPDPTKYQYWFKLTAGPVAEGFFYYLNGAWTKPDTAIAPGSITEAKLADEAASTEKFEDSAITDAKIKPPILLSKWQPGPANSFAKMDSIGSVPTWDLNRLVSTPVPLAFSTTFEFVHNLGVIPAIAEAYITATVPFFSGPEAVPEGQEIRITALNFATSGYNRNLVELSGSNSVLFKTPASLYLHWGYTQSVISVPSNWTVQFKVLPL